MMGMVKNVGIAEICSKRLEMLISLGNRRKCMGSCRERSWAVGKG
jgi:hypothetical protein